ncbi:hypothetical protein [Acaryochloris sp. 'Moss Beach']|uniref:hypothetical protein n=1 Tax=Acaryochloris sp. 'Moss Beach' TaxID=2740837 RepID=UPI001F408F7C|nr:hypothetical protein [Acaryochloris sp. 'Moss Beach']
MQQEVERVEAILPQEFSSVFLPSRCSVLVDGWYLPKRVKKSGGDTDIINVPKPDAPEINIDVPKPEINLPKPDIDVSSPSNEKSE